MLPRHPSSATRRLALGGAAVVVVAAGLGVHLAVPGVVGDALADALYAVLVYLIVALIAPRLRTVVTAAIAFALCAAVELLQLTGLPEALTGLWAPFRLLLGTTFSAADLLAYAGGVVVVALVDAGARRRARRTAAR
ncbi:DUF2809 domain-containing protein [Compostimonas suwonensis]|uniref:ribosomal maturation YjgA family protein n=1 Tax=Compostimonas suwonensis TaxID=1048394 RepID=UPI001FE5E6F2|nr:DUF2809 domain-containing protein [Compostimonas suwonensis]